MTDNMKLWDAVCKTNPDETKEAKIGGMNITAIAPQYQIRKATEQFGPYGVKWGFKQIELDYSLVDKFDLVVFKGTFFCPDGEFQIINSCKMFMDRNKKMVDADFAKKIETDALTKALSKLGFNADVFEGKFEDHRYIAELHAEKAANQPLVATADDQAWIDAINAGTNKLEEVLDINYRNRIARLLQEQQQ